MKRPALLLSRARLLALAGGFPVDLVRRPHQVADQPLILPLRRASPGRPQRIQTRGVGISIAFDDATDCRCHRGQLVVGEVNYRHR
jgi:hypothetical protein